MPASDVVLLIDTGPIVASLVAKEDSHDECNAVLDRVHFVYTSWPVITEAVYLLGDYSPAVEKLFALLRGRVIQLLTLDRTDIDRIEQIMAKYADQNFQLADASLMHLAEREGIEQVLTIDQQDFALFRTAKGRRLTLLPAATG